MKIFKLFVCLSLILSISLINSFAAISVSDGSAFVTKAEFAADLNNLSNRMSSLENSLDAKIDSLVSSYLSRNGIWNGEKQEIDSKFKNEAMALNKVVWIKDYNNKNKNNYLVFRSHQDTLISNIVIVDSISKAGLCMIDFIGWQFAIQLTSGGLGGITSSTSYGHSVTYDNAVSYGWSGNVSYGFYCGKSTDTIGIDPSYGSCSGHVVQEVIISPSYLSGTTVNQNIYLIAQKKQTTVSFFIEKGQRLFLSTYLYGGGGRYSKSAWAAFQWSAQINSGVIPASPSFNVSNVVVY